MADQVDALSPAGVSELASFIIRPPRAHYARSELGDRVFITERVPARRDDVVLRNARGLQLYASHFRPVDSPSSIPTVVYLHGNGSCRVEATMLLHYILPYGLSLFAFDFSGSGMSDGEYISLGVNEKHDVETVVDYLITTCRVQTIVLWGHSMGAATALMYAGLCKRRPQVKALVLDSPFASFDKLAQSMVAEMPIPLAVPRKLILTVGVRAVRKVVRERAEFDVIDIDPLSAAKKMNYQLPALFLHGTADAVVPLQHGELLHKNYPCKEKQFVVMHGFEHDTPRPEWVMDKAHVFLQKYMMDDGIHGSHYLEHLKARGNSAMLSGRYQDSIYLYTEALDALALSITSKTFAVALGESLPTAKPENLDPDDREGRLARRNSSISNFVSTVKRWRYPRISAHAEDIVSSRISSPSARGSKLPREETTDLATRGHASRNEPLLTNSEKVAPSRISDPTAESTHDHELNSPDPPGLDCSRSESSARSGRFSRNWAYRPWYTRSLIETIRNKLRMQRSQTNSTTTPNPEVCEAEALTTSGVTPEVSQDNTSPNTSPTASAKLMEEKRIKGVANRRTQKGLSWRSPGIARTSRSSSKTHIRHRGKQRQSRRKSRQVDGIETDGKRNEWHGNEEGKWRMTPDLVSIRNRFIASDVISRQEGNVENGNQPAKELAVPKSMKAWNFDQERKAMALALLGNRSLARRKVKNVEGALFDAQLCLDLDASWTRGYVRKAAALREDGRLREARECILEGLQQDAEHAGLADMLHSIDVAIDAEQLARERNAAHREATADVVSAQA